MVILICDILSIMKFYVIYHLLAFDSGYIRLYIGYRGNE